MTRRLLFGFTLIFLVMGASSTHGSGDVFDNSGSAVSIPEYENHREMLTQFVAPFLLVTILLQAGIYKALEGTLLPDRDEMQGMYPDKVEKEESRVKKYSILIALAASGMMIPTSPFQMLGEYVSVLFGGAVFLFFAVIVGAFIYKLLF